MTDFLLRILSVSSSGNIERSGVPGAVDCSIDGVKLFVSISHVPSLPAALHSISMGYLLQQGDMVKPNSTKLERREKSENVGSAVIRRTAAGKKN